MCNPIRCKGLRCSFTFYQLSHGANVNIFIYFVLAGLFKSKFCELWQILKPCVPEAACFPEYFALQSGSCILALGGAPSSWAKLLMTIATMLALVNQLVLGPRTAQLMVSYTEDFELGVDVCVCVTFGIKRVRLECLLHFSSFFSRGHLEHG